MLKKSMLRLIVLVALFTCLAAPAYAAVQPAYIQFNESSLVTATMNFYDYGQPVEMSDLPELEKQ